MTYFCVSSVIILSTVSWGFWLLNFAVITHVKPRHNAVKQINKKQAGVEALT